MNKIVRLKKTQSAETRYTGGNAERETKPATYDVYVNDVLVGRLVGYVMGRIKGNPSGHKFIGRDGHQVKCGTVSSRGYYRKQLNEAAIHEFDLMNQATEEPDTRHIRWPGSIG